MGILDSVKKVLGVWQISDDDDYMEEQSEFESYSAYSRGRAGAAEKAQPEEKTPYSKVVPMPTIDKNLKVVYISPREYDDARVVCDRLKAFAPVVVKLDLLEQNEAQRVIDFIMGACYTLDGHVQEIKEDVFLVAPSMVNIEKVLGDVSTVKSGSFFSKFL
jgi:cell division inhibitor SepF